MSDELLAGFGGALIGAVLAGVFAWIIHRSEQISSRRQELRAAITALIQLSEEHQTRLSTIADPSAREAAGVIINMKKQVYLEAAETLTNKIPRHVLSSEFTILGINHMNESNFKKAEECYFKAVKVSQTSATKITALRSLAIFYFAQSPQQDFDAGRKYFQRAVDILKTARDAYSLYLQGYTYEVWGFNEFNNGFKTTAVQKFESAKEYYEDMPISHPLRNQALEYLTIKLRNAMNANKPLPEVNVSASSQVAAQLVSTQPPPISAEVKNTTETDLDTTIPTPQKEEAI
jgi:tetratricopeptide (TPR) repeat protein